MAQFQELFDVSVTWWPFELHPETPLEGRHVDEIIAPSRRSEEYREHLKNYAREAGIELASNRIVANSHRALEFAEFARDRGHFDAAHEALFRAYFTEARDIGNTAVLADIADEVGLDREEWLAEVELGRYAALVDQATAIARQQGATSTPLMIFDDRFVLTGAQDLNVYINVLERLGAKRKDADASA
ncbi:MAG: DsbA family protein [Dehalococcoidia bacterium]|nr:DsbA family protein [Dehalococcoidia bacterium]